MPGRSVRSAMSAKYFWGPTKSVSLLIVTEPAPRLPCTTRRATLRQILPISRSSPRTPASMV